MECANERRPDGVRGESSQWKQLQEWVDFYGEKVAAKRPWEREQDGRCRLVSEAW